MRNYCYGAYYIENEARKEPVADEYKPLDAVGILG